MTTSEYTGGNNGWGTMIVKCSICGEVIEEWEVDELGVPTNLIFRDEDHDCLA